MTLYGPGSKDSGRARFSFLLLDMVKELTSGCRRGSLFSTFIFGSMVKVDLIVSGLSLLGDWLELFDFQIVLILSKEGSRDTSQSKPDRDEREHRLTFIVTAGWLRSLENGVIGYVFLF